MQYTIEARQLSGDSTQQRSADGQPRRTLIEAGDADEAITQFVVQSESELVSVTRVPRHREAIATVKKDDSVYLVRIYAA